MMYAMLPLLAESVLRTTFEWGRIQSNADWILPIGVLVAVLLFVRYMYRRDAVELRRPWAWLLTALRMAAFLGLLVLYLQPHWRSEREEVRNSRALLLVDTSLSMGLSDDSSRGQPGTTLNRAQQVAKGLTDSDFLDRLRKTHDVTVIPFSDDLKRDHAVTLGKLTTANKSADDTIYWPGLLAPTGTDTRLGQALRQLIQDERGTPVSGIIVFSDGGQNAGVSPDAAVELAREARIPIFTVGLGSDRQPTNVGVADLAVPARAYPGDHYTVTAYVQAQGLAGKTVTVEVLSRAAGSSSGTSLGRARSGRTARDAGAGEVLQRQQVTLGGDGEVVPVKFELAPDAPGRRTLCVRIQAPVDDHNSADNSREADIEIVDRKSRVLLLADGPMREYQFLRNQLYRDRYTTVDVLLQSGRPGLSQEARKILDEFPSTRQEMWDYDCVVAFDPNWEEIGASRARLLEKWVAEQGGGLIVIAGPVNTCKGVGGWVGDPAMSAIRNLYPVEFPGRLAATESSVYATREAWPLDFTREGAQSDFLWLGDAAVASQEAWSHFPGVFSCCPVRGPKPGAAVYARFSDPRFTPGGQPTVYMAGQFYGSGSVFYLGSGEMWRLRSVNDAYFEQFYTKLIRHVSQGRLLRGSSRGVLLVGQDHYLLGGTIEVRAQLSNGRLEPLVRPSVNLQVIGPDGATQTIALRPDPSRAGAYLGQLPALLEGTYRLELPIPESENERLSRRVQVDVPNVERTNPRRNDALLSQIAKNSGGKYYVGMASAMATTGQPPPLTAQLRDRTNTVVLPVAPNPQQEEARLRWMMNVLCGVLCLEWLVRRLLKLA
ncbi:MAG: VWA domain-containing protein [Planctomycetaceae bacterium]|nr:VWA domain-containing protein [Planctomycetaceae bacterium]